MRNMFIVVESFNQPLDKWDTSNVKSMVSMFENTSSFNQNLESWANKLGKDCEIEFMFLDSPLGYYNLPK